MHESSARGINEQGDTVGAWNDTDSYILLHKEYQALHLVAAFSVFGAPNAQERFTQGALVHAVNNSRVMAGTLLQGAEQQVFVLTPRPGNAGK